MFSTSIGTGKKKKQKANPHTGSANTGGTINPLTGEPYGGILSAVDTLPETNADYERGAFSRKIDIGNWGAADESDEDDEEKDGDEKKKDGTTTGKKAAASLDLNE